MFAKISLTAAFFLMGAPSMASASITRRAVLAPPGMVVAQEGQTDMGTSDNDSDNDSDSNDNADDNQNNDANQADQNAAGNDQPVAIPPTVLGQPEGEQLEPRQDPMNSYQPQPVNPYQ
jgi:hypothetical protein